METKVTARYEDVLKFIENEVIDCFKSATELEKKIGLPAKLSADMAASNLAGKLPLIAFIYGKTENEVADDISAMLDRLKEMKW